MVTILNEWQIFEWDEKAKLNKLSMLLIYASLPHKTF